MADCATESNTGPCAHECNAVKRYIESRGASRVRFTARLGLVVKVLVRARQPRVGEHHEVGPACVPHRVEAAAIVLGVHDHDHCAAARPVGLQHLVNAVIACMAGGGGIGQLGHATEAPPPSLWRPRSEGSPLGPRGRQPRAGRASAAAASAWAAVREV